MTAFELATIAFIILIAVTNLNSLITGPDADGVYPRWYVLTVVSLVALCLVATVNLLFNGVL